MEGGSVSDGGGIRQGSTEGCTHESESRLKTLVDRSVEKLGEELGHAAQLLTEAVSLRMMH